MAKSFDASTKFLVELNPTDWLRLLGLPLGPTRIAEADFSTVSASTDRLVVVDASPTPYGLLTEFQGNADATFEDRLLEYSILAKRRLGLPVLAVAVLLRPFAGHGLLRGRSTMRGPDGELLLDFRYRVLRVWQMPPEAFLSGGLAVLPLAAVARTRRSDLPRILNRIGERLEAEATLEQADLLRTATFVLMGLKFDQSVVEKIMSQNVLELSSTYQALQAKGIEKGIAQGIAQSEQRWRSEEARRMVLRLGAKRLGEPSGEVIAAVEGISDLETLEAIMDRLLIAESWQELLA